MIDRVRFIGFSVGAVFMYFFFYAVESLKIL